MSFEYLLSKIAQADFETVPFRHIYIRDFFEKQDFSQIVSSPEILIPSAESDEQLFNMMFERNYKIIDFPGCITSKDLYLKWHNEKNSHARIYNNSSCEGFGITLRLTQPTSPVINDLSGFLRSDAFQTALADKFGIKRDEVFYDGGIQKYLDGYEISPHPDIRAKALTYMININPGQNSETREHHTNYLKFRDEFKYVQAYWDGHPNQDRCWVPWDWCDVTKVQTENNSLVIFSPDNTTLHAVRARYDHLLSQRTQLYGNLWYNWFGKRKYDPTPKWEDFRIQVAEPEPEQVSVISRVKAAVPPGLKSLLNGGRPKADHDGNVIKDRLKS